MLFHTYYHLCDAGELRVIVIMGFESAPAMRGPTRSRFPEQFRAKISGFETASVAILIELASRVPQTTFPSDLTQRSVE